MLLVRRFCPLLESQNIFNRNARDQLEQAAGEKNEKILIATNQTGKNVIISPIRCVAVKFSAVFGPMGVQGWTYLCYDDNT